MTQGFSEKPGISGKSDLHSQNKLKTKTPPSKVKIKPSRRVLTPLELNYLKFIQEWFDTGAYHEEGAMEFLFALDDTLKLSGDEKWKSQGNSYIMNPVSYKLMFERIFKQGYVETFEEKAFVKSIAKTNWIDFTLNVVNTKSSDLYETEVPAYHILKNKSPKEIANLRKGSVSLYAIELGDFVRIPKINYLDNHDFNDTKSTKRLMELNGLFLEHVKNQTPEIALAAVKENGESLKFVKNQTDKICLAAVKQYPFSLQYVENQTPEIVMEAVKLDGRVLHYIEKQTPEIVKLALDMNRFREFSHHQHVNDEMRKLPVVQKMIEKSKKYFASS